jgi:hypothetical protein
MLRKSAGRQDVFSLDTINSSLVSWASQALALLHTAAASASSQLWLSEDKLKETTALARRLTGHSGSVCFKPLLVLQNCGKVLNQHMENWKG